VRAAAVSLVLAVIGALSGCSGIASNNSQDLNLVAGPAIRDVTTSFDNALECLRGRIRPEVIFGVGQIADSTGKESFSEGGTGKFVTQGAGEIVQSALFRAGVSIVNRRDAGILATEANWGIRELSSQVPVHFYVSGSINSLDFIPGGGASLTVMGMGVRARQHRILVALDLAMTDAFTGKVVASVPLQKQIVANEVTAGGDQFFGETLVALEIGGMQREALHFALRQMLSLATLELLGQLMDANVFEPCRQMVGLGMDDALLGKRTADPEAVSAVQRRLMAANAPPLAVPVVDARTVASAEAQSGLQPVPVAAQAGTETASDGMSREEAMREVLNVIRSNAVLAIREADAALAAETREEAIRRATTAVTQANRSMVILRQAAGLGLEGDEGDAAAIVVEQAMTRSRKAAIAAAQHSVDGAAGPPNAVGSGQFRGPEEPAASEGFATSIARQPQSFNRSGR
jgi:curli biogenesis system outer membrane secretion channel CsgG